MSVQKIGLGKNISRCRHCHLSTWNNRWYGKLTEKPLMKDTMAFLSMGKSIERSKRLWKPWI